MRLVDTHSLKLVEFTEDKTPYGRYAVLSHRWSDDEVTFKEFRKGLNKDSIGHRKIVAACEYAKAQRHAYIWIDTCCIDKRSSAELSEAINSMFRWCDAVMPQSFQDCTHIVQVPAFGSMLCISSRRLI